MNAITRIQVEFNEPVLQAEIPLRLVSATTAHLPITAWARPMAKPGNYPKDASFNQRAAEVGRFIARIREILQKQEA